jgi:hypothetical protein
MTKGPGTTPGPFALLPPSLSRVAVATLPKKVAELEPDGPLDHLIKKAWYFRHFGETAHGL